MKLANRFLLSLGLFCLLFFFGCGTDKTGSENTEKSNSTNSIVDGSGKNSVNENKSVDNSSEKNEDNSAKKDDSKTDSNGIESIYTDLKADKCKTIESNEDEGWIKQECPGVGIYKLELTEGDLRQTINVVSNSGDRWELDFSLNVSSAFSAFGEKAEWRVKKVDGKPIPIALITRYNVAENPDKPEKNTSYLVVTKFSSEFVCITDVIKPIPNANEKARELADNSANKPCLQAK